MNVRRLRRDVLTVTGLHESDEMDYWKSRSPEERLEAVQIHREHAYGYEEANARLKRVLEVFKR